MHSVNAASNSDNIEETYLEIYRHMLAARVIDKYEDQYTSSGAAFFHVSGGGHEATAGLAPYLIPEDYVHLHYRDKALMLARGISIDMFFHSLFCKDVSHSRGRQMSAHLSDRELNVMSLVGPVGNNALQAVGAAHAIKDQSAKPLVVCSMGEGTSQEGEVLEAIAEAVRSQLPMLFLVQDNNFAISTLTDGKTFYNTPKGEHDSFYSMPVTRVDGRSVAKAADTFKTVTSEIRDGSGPQVVVFKVERLDSHSNADDHRIYRASEDIEEINKTSDPITIFEKYLLETVDRSKLKDIKSEVEAAVKTAADKSIRTPEPEPIFTAKKDLPEKFFSPDSEYRGSSEKDLTMLEAMREVLRHWLGKDDKVTLYGEDLEDPKGDVFGVTKGLSTQFPGRVINSPLAEATIVGVAAGRALAGEKPVAFLQFADFLPIALNQIITEIATMHWRTDGAWECPMVVMITCGGYRPGLGPFHAQTFEALATHTPGIDVCMPATAGDAAGLLNTAFESGRPTLIFYPKSCLNEKENATSKDVEKQFIPLGRSRSIRSGKDLTLIGWGNTVSRCLKAADALEDSGFSCDVIDLRTLSPWDKEAVFNSAAKTGKVIVTHEDNLTCGMGAEVLAAISEQHVDTPMKVARVTRDDTFVPCNFANQLEVLPSYKRILEKSCELLDCSVEWEKPPAPEAGISFIEAIGTSPSDETITIHEWLIEEGEDIEEGQEVALFEANKATAEMLAQVSGEVIELLIEEGSTVTVGTPIMKIKNDQEDTVPKPVTFERPGTPHITRNPKQSTTEDSGTVKKTKPAAIAAISVVHGENTVSNEEIIKNFDDKVTDDITQVTGIEQRNHITEGQNLLSLATSAAEDVLKKSKLSIEDIDAIICSTGTPDIVTPSLACRVLNNLSGDKDVMTQAHDINAACSGYIYGLQNAHDILSNNENANVLLITSEVLSPLLDKEDFGTAIIFGDAATATIISNCTDKGLIISRPELSASGESGKILSVPVSRDHGSIFMNGRKVFSKAVKQMSIILERACGASGVNLKDLDLVVPHQANQRIIDAIISRNDLDPDKVYSNISNYGNTSSNTIPICLEELWNDLGKNSKLGLCAFGGGFTFGAALLTVNK